MKESIGNGERDRTKQDGITRRTAAASSLGLAILAALASTFPASAQERPKKSTPEKAPKRSREVLKTSPRNLRDLLRGQLKAGATVSIDATVAESVRGIWEREYRTAALPKAKPEDPKVGVLDSVLAKMEPHLPRLRETFKKHGVPEWCLFLTIVESRFRTDLVSQAGAVGPYQFIEETGATYGLVEYAEGKIVRDDRTDVLKSADACARLLKDNFAIYKKRGASDADAWKFATHQYNGSFAHLYALRHANGAPTYAGFLSFMKERMNARLTRAREATEHVVQKGESLGMIVRRSRITLAQLLAENTDITNPNVVQPGAIIRIPALPEEDTATYIVKAGDTLSKIAKHLGTTVDKLKAENQLKSDVIALGTRFKVPADARFAADVLARNRVARLGGLVENLEYTLKLEGLLRVLKQRGIVTEIP